MRAFRGVGSLRTPSPTYDGVARNERRVRGTRGLGRAQTSRFDSWHGRNLPIGGTGDRWCHYADHPRNSKTAQNRMKPEMKISRRLSTDGDRADSQSRAEVRDGSADAVHARRIRQSLCGPGGFDL